MDKNELALEFLKLSKEIEQKEKEKKELMAKIFTTDFEKLIVGDKQIIKVVKRPVSIKKGMEEEVMKKFPDAVKKNYSMPDEIKQELIVAHPNYFEVSESIDMKVLQTTFEAQDYLEMKEKPELHIKKYNDENF